MNALPPTLLWFRQDLRLQDNPALNAAVARGAAIIPLFILDDAGEGRWPMGAASRWWLHHSLVSLADSLRVLGSRLILLRGDSSATLEQLRRATGGGALYWNRRYEPAAIARDAAIAEGFSSNGVEVKTFNASLLHEPHEVANKQGRPFQVFTPFWRHSLTLPVAPPEKFAAKTLPVPATWPLSLELAQLDLIPRINWYAGLVGRWQPGEAQALRRLGIFSKRRMSAYAEERDVPGSEGSSMLSAALHFGEVSPRQVWAAVRATSKSSGIFPSSKGARVFLSELGWREFAYHSLVHFPSMPESPFREAFRRFPWAADPRGEKLRAWQRGRTGYPIVDAGMRQLWATGWMHNRVRMITGSFLVKHLRLPWTQGAEWFWDTLVDADLANNTLGWQWITGCGADAAPYFRVFAPVLQGRKFDADGAYVRRWVPELARLPNDYLHAPWEAPPSVLATAGIKLGETYPKPIVAHAAARNEALAAFRTLRRETQSAALDVAGIP